MNKKGQYWVFGISVAVMMLIAVVLLIEPMKDFIVDARDSTHLDCNNASISTGQKATCIVVDWWMFYFVLTAMGVAGGYLIGARAKREYVQ